MGNSRPQTALPLPPTEKNISEARDVVLIGHRSSHFELLQTSHIFYSAPPMCCRHGKQRIRQRKCQEEEGEEGLRLFCADEATRKQQNDCKSPPGSRHPLQKQASDTICSRHPEVQNVRQSSRTKRIKKTRKRRRRLSTSAGSHAGKVLP